ncbi:hypothetical protein ANO11243_005320 [Dothideomycetidae sp. 11243]|nr:hypothetical protein ANO11243_005320 [fungal sp. No.11243]
MHVGLSKNPSHYLSNGPLIPCTPTPNALSLELIVTLTVPNMHRSTTHSTIADLVTREFGGPMRSCIADPADLAVVTAIAAKGTIRYMNHLVAKSDRHHVKHREAALAKSESRMKVGRTRSGPL